MGSVSTLLFLCPFGFQFFFPLKFFVFYCLINDNLGDNIGRRMGPNQVKCTAIGLVINLEKKKPTLTDLCTPVQPVAQPFPNSKS